MEFSFKPKQLMTAQKEIAVLHKSKKELLESIKVEDDEEFKKLINDLVKMDRFSLAVRIGALSEEKIWRITGYLPYNFYNVDMSNLFSIFIKMADENLCDILYKQWQNSYNNIKCNEFICLLLKNNEVFRKYISGTHLNIEAIAGIFNDSLEDPGIIVNRFGSEVMNYPFTEKKTMAEKFNFFGINENSKLYKDCKELFYTYCGKEDYLNADKSEILNVIKIYQKRDRSLLNAFITNFISKLDLIELGEFQDLARYFEAILGDIQHPQGSYKTFFSGISSEIKEKYMDWINRCRIIQYFGNDERSTFWKQYRFMNVQRYNKSNAVVMEFEEYVAVEFLGKAMGPIYFYPKKYFLENLRIQFLILENAPMRKYLLHKTQYRDKDRIIHIGYWQGYVEDYIIEYNITQRVF